MYMVHCCCFGVRVSTVRVCLLARLLTCISCHVLSDVSLFVLFPHIFFPFSWFPGFLLLSGDTNKHKGSLQRQKAFFPFKKVKVLSKDVIVILWLLIFHSPSPFHTSATCKGGKMFTPSQQQRLLWHTPSKCVILFKIVT